MWHRLKSWFGRESKISTPQSIRKDPEFLGAFLIDQMLGKRFGVDTGEVTKDMRPELRNVFPKWAGIYLGWVFRVGIAARYGKEFADRMMTASRTLLKRLEELEPERAGLVASFDFWFVRLDEATKHMGTKVRDVELPFEYFVGLTFLALDEESPYYRQTEINDGTEIAVAEAFVKAKAKALPLIQSCIAIGGPISSP